MLKFRLYGAPVAHSYSPLFQDAGFASLGVQGTYVAEEVDTAGLREAAQRVRVGAVRGANITLPWKREALALADTASTWAMRLGVANTWWTERAGVLHASNTDVHGVEAMLDRLGEAQGRSMQRALLLGTGGAARAVLGAMLSRGMDVVVVGRRREALEGVLAWGRGHESGAAGRVRGVPWSEEACAGAWVAQTELVVDATSLALQEHEEAARAYRVVPWDALPPTCRVWDLSVSASPTHIARRAASAGLYATDGAYMLLVQGALACRLWTEEQPSWSAIEGVLATALQRGSIGKEPSHAWWTASYRAERRQVRSGVCASESF